MRDRIGPRRRAGTRPAPGGRWIDGACGGPRNLPRARYDGRTGAINAETVASRPPDRPRRTFRRRSDLPAAHPAGRGTARPGGRRPPSARIRPSVRPGEIQGLASPARPSPIGSKGRASASRRRRRRGLGPCRGPSSILSPSSNPRRASSWAGPPSSSLPPWARSSTNRPGNGRKGRRARALRRRSSVPIRPGPPAAFRPSRARPSAGPRP